MPLLARLVAVALLHGARATRDACDLRNTSAAWATQEVHLPGCEASFHEEDALLEHSCASSSGEPAADQSEFHHAVCACMRRRWWRAARLLLPRISTSASVGEVRRFASHARDGAADAVTMLLRGSSTGIRHDAVTSVVPAVQWAQVRVRARVRVWVGVTVTVTASVTVGVRAAGTMHCPPRPASAISSRRYCGTCARS